MAEEALWWQICRDLLCVLSCGRYMWVYVFIGQASLHPAPLGLTRETPETANSLKNISFI